MACYHPLKAWPVGVNPETGKTAYKVTPYNVLDVAEKTGDCIEIPCGKCVGCRLAYSRQWADRCLLESLYHPYNYFLTLTYDDEHVPHSSYWSEDDDWLDCLTLCKRDLQLFFKRVRKDFQFRYYACGEYGENTFRPHYHVIMFSDTPLTDLKAVRFERGNWFYHSDYICNKWGYGHILVGDVTWQSCAYVARYVMKKVNGLAADDYKFFNIEPEFVVMSRKPGIASQYYADHRDEIYNKLSFSVATSQGGKRLRPSKYFDRLFDLEFPEQMSNIKLLRRTSAEIARDLKLSKTDLDWQSYLAVEEEAVLDRAKKLIRGDCFEEKEDVPW